MKNLKITLVQTPLEWQNSQANLEVFSHLLDGLEQTDLVVLPEMFSTGFTMDAKKNAQYMDGDTVKWMQEIAEKLNAVITGSLIVEDNGEYFNRLIWMKPDGTFSHYDKRHLFRMAEEDKYFSPGKQRLLVELNGWKILPLICYDLRFPVWSRNNNEYDLALYVANWPVPRIHSWDVLLRARAIENQCYVAGVNRTGEDGNSIPYCGHSVVIDPKGQEVLNLGEENTVVKTVELDGNSLLDFRKKFPFYLDADPFTLGRKN